MLKVLSRFVFGKGSQRCEMKIHASEQRWYDHAKTRTRYGLAVRIACTKEKNGNGHAGRLAEKNQLVAQKRKSKLDCHGSLAD